VVWLLAAVATHTLIATWTGTAGSDAQTDCVPCKGGSLNKQGVCECPKDFYLKDGDCKGCPGGGTTDGSGAESVDECTCPDGKAGPDCDSEHAGSCRLVVGSCQQRQAVQPGCQQTAGGGGGGRLPAGIGAAAARQLCIW
jgi:hypothetical protein